MSLKAGSEHELPKMPSPSSYNSLLTSDVACDNAHDRSKPPSNSYPKSSSLLRHFRLQIAIPAFAKLGSSNWNAAIEYRKTAVYKNRKVAAAHGLLHFIPFAGAMTLLIFQWTGYWVSREDDYRTSLQFAAKSLELVMQASIIEVLLCLVRTRLINDMVPLGALTSTIQATQLSYLWSLDFLSLFRSHTLQGWRRIVFLIAIPALVSLTSLVGPSSAILMIPRPNSAKVGDTTTIYQNGSIESLYPSQIGVTKGLIFNMERHNTSMQYSELSDNDETDGSKSRLYQDFSADFTSRVLRSDSVKPPLQGQQNEEVHIATIPTVFATKTLTYHNVGMLNGTITVRAAHPIVTVQCLAHRTTGIDTGSTLKYLKDDLISIGELPAVSTLIEKVSDHYSETDRFQSNLSNVWFNPVWIRSPESNSTSSVVVLFDGSIPSASANESTQAHLTQMLAQQGSTKSKSKLFATTCTVSACWNTDEIQLRKYSMNQFVQTALLSAQKKSDTRSITLNFTHADTFQTARFHHSLGLYYDDGSRPRGALGPSLARILAVTLAIWPDVPTSFSWYVNPNNGLRVATPNSTAFRFVRTDYGYGYGARSTPVHLSMVVLIVYCAITASYMLYSLVTGSASTAWNSGTELFALALQSKKPDYLGHTSVGIDSMKTFSEGVGVRVNAENELEIVFANDRDIGTRGLTKIVRNRAY